MGGQLEVKKPWSSAFHEEGLGRGQEVKEQCLPEYQAEIEKYKPKSCSFFQILGFAGGEMFFVVVVVLFIVCFFFFPP